MKIKRLKYACYTANVTMSVVGNLSPVLFLTFRSLYQVSYSLLGLLIFLNFITQLAIDLIFSFFSHKFNISKTVKFIPIIAVFGFLIYACWPFVFPNSVYMGLVIGTLIFAAASGLNEVLISPVIASIPSENPDREMSKLHSVYAWGVVFVIVISTIFLLVAGNQNWQWLVFIFLLIPIISALLFAGCTIGPLETPKHTRGAIKLLANRGVWLCVVAMFLGGAAECTMAQWSSSYLERAFAVPKIWGDLLGVAMFSVMLGLGRTLYAKFGKNIERVLVLGAIGAAICYFLAVFSNTPWVALFACAFTGLCTSMLWPGNLVIASNRFSQGGVFIFALMAAAGDMGASVIPQLVGIVTDAVIANPDSVLLAQRLSLLPEQLAMKVGMFFAAFFVLSSIFFYFKIWIKRKVK